MNKIETGPFAKGVACLRPDFLNGCISDVVIFLITLPLLPWYFLLS